MWWWKVRVISLNGFIRVDELHRESPQTVKRVRPFLERTSGRAPCQPGSLIFACASIKFLPVEGVMAET